MEQTKAVLVYWYSRPKERKEKMCFLASMVINLKKFLHDSTWSKQGSKIFQSLSRKGKSAVIRLMTPADFQEFLNHIFKHQNFTFTKI